MRDDVPCVLGCDGEDDDGDGDDLDGLIHQSNFALTTTRANCLGKVNSTISVEIKIYPAAHQPRGLCALNGDRLSVLATVSGSAFTVVIMATPLLRHSLSAIRANGSVPTKTTDEVDWINPLKNYIRQTYDDPDKFTEVFNLQAFLYCIDMRNVLLYRDYDRIPAEQAKTLQDETFSTAITANSNSSTYASQSTKTTSESHLYGTMHSVKNPSVNIP